MKWFKVACVALLVLFVCRQPAHAQQAWTYIYQGAVQIYNTSTTSASSTQADTYIGDQAFCGTTLSCYFHTTPITGFSIPANSRYQLPLTISENIASGASDADYQAEYVYVTTSQISHCTSGTNAYITTEHNPGANVAGSGDGAGVMWMSHQGGSNGKACDNFTIPASTSTQVESDNAGSYNPDGTLFLARPRPPVLDLSVCSGPKATHPKAWASPEDKATGNTALMVDACPGQ